MPGENFGMAYLQSMGEAQKQDQLDKLNPLELAHKQAVTRLDQANAGAVELSTQMQRSGMEALRGFEFDKSDPGKSLLEMAARVAPSQPVLAEKILSAASMSTYRQSQADAAKALAAERSMKTAASKVNAMTRAYGDLPSTSPEMLGLARQVFRQELSAAGADESEISEAIATVEQAIKEKGPGVIKYLHDRSMSAYQRIQTEHLKQQEEEQRRKDAALAGHRAETGRLAREREARQAAKASADGKAGGKPSKEPRPRIAMGELLPTSVLAISKDPILGTGEKSDQLKWAREVAEKTLEKVDASYAERQRNPNIPLKSREDARREAIDELRGRVKQDPTTMQRLAEKLGGDPGKPAGPAQEKKPKTGAPSLVDFLERARKLNPGVSDKDLKAHWEKTYAE